MISKLNEYTKNKDYVSLYMDSEDTSKFVFGRILGIDEDYIAVGMISPEGEYDGILVKETAAIIRLEVGDAYIKEMQRLCIADDIAWNLNVVENQNILDAVLEYARREQKIVSCELMNSGVNDVIGFLEKSQNGLCEIKQVNSDGNEDGFSYIMKSVITQVSCDSKDEQFRMKLWKENVE